MIKVSNLTKVYGVSRGIKNINFEIDKGQVVGFLGPNGAGKTTTMKLITGSMAATRGEIWVNGFDMSENSVAARRNIGYLPEVPPLYEELEVRQYLHYVGRLQGVEEAFLKERIDVLIADLDLKDVAYRLVQHLSKGFRQRVGLAQALIAEPDVLILDEPTSGLDPKQVAHMRDLIRSLKGKHTLILSSHILSEVEALCERVIIMKEGEIVAQGTLDQLKKGVVLSVYLRVARPPVSFETDLKAVSGVQSVSSHANKGKEGWRVEVIEETHIETLAGFVVNSGAGLLELNCEGQNLENIFMDIIQ